jgi:hypothetical protein
MIEVMSDKCSQNKMKKIMKGKKITNEIMTNYLLHYAVTRLFVPSFLTSLRDIRVFVICGFQT